MSRAELGLDFTSGNEKILSKVVSLTTGNDNVVLAADSGFKHQIVAIEASTDTAMRLRVHWGNVADIGTLGRPVTGGYVPASGGLIKGFGALGPSSTLALKASLGTPGNVDVIVHYVKK